MPLLSNQLVAMRVAYIVYTRYMIGVVVGKHSSELII